MKISFLILTILISSKSFAQITTDLSGVWKGTSTCQIKDSPCNDEIAVYHFSKMVAPNIYRITMNKMIENKEIVMGTLDFTYDNSNQTLTSINSTSRWNFKVNGFIIEGSLVYKGELYRIIKVKKEN